ncbi:hypothetical protein CHARACLAT_021263 [Characodon lateralis]|uniref:Uncharacterized protein n=1 Tax=Characodon lateralis TaxID=208331 RepID=A0ABU7EYR6_9TELE|nr:hypothetical protein [Characodon lateralis]
MFWHTQHWTLRSGCRNSISSAGYQNRPANSPITLITPVIPRLDGTAVSHFRPNKVQHGPLSRNMLSQVKNTLQQHNLFLQCNSTVDQSQVVFTPSSAVDAIRLEFLHSASPSLLLEYSLSNKSDLLNPVFPSSPDGAKNGFLFVS